MANHYAWPYYPAPAYNVQFPPSPGGPGFQPGHQYSRSWGTPGSPYSPPVLPLPLPIPPVHGRPQPPPAPVPAPPGATPYPNPTYLHPGYPHARRHSFDHSYLQAAQPPPQAPAPVWPYYPAPASHPEPAPWYPHSPHSWHFPPQHLPPPQLHSLLNGDALPQYLQLDLSAFELKPCRRAGAGVTVPLTTRELDQPATTPELIRVRIVCDLIPQWPVELFVTGTTLTPRRPGRAQFPYITLGDVLFAVHHMLHKKISHEDWGRLTASQETEVARAYTRRFKAFAAVERQQQREGVKKVDYLLRNYYFRGMTWLAPENGIERMKLLVGPPE